MSDSGGIFASHLGATARRLALASLGLSAVGAGLGAWQGLAVSPAVLMLVVFGAAATVGAAPGSAPARWRRALWLLVGMLSAAALVALAVPSLGLDTVVARLAALGVVAFGPWLLAPLVCLLALAVAGAMGPAGAGGSALAAVAGLALLVGEILRRLMLAPVEPSAGLVELCALAPLSLAVLALHGTSPALAPMFRPGRAGRSVRWVVAGAVALPSLIALRFGPEASTAVIAALPLPVVEAVAATLFILAFRAGRIVGPPSAPGSVKGDTSTGNAATDRWLIIFLGGLMGTETGRPARVAGARLVEAVETTLALEMRRSDFLIRPDAQTLCAAARVGPGDDPVRLCERLRNAILGGGPDDGGPRPTSVSIGFARHEGPLDGAREPMARARRAMCLAMAEGRNRIADGDRLVPTAAPARPVATAAPAR